MAVNVWVNLSEKQTVSSHIVNLDPDFILKTQLALGDTEYISLTLSLFFFLLDNLMNFISVYVSTSFIFLLA